tara:strand:+ start:76 stop:459 length:384 start_codon:yes stop_codon:yes gene_type:complete
MANLLSTTIDGSITEKEGTGTVSGTTITVDLATGNFFEIDLASATGSIGTITVNNAAASGISTFVLKLKQGSTYRGIKWSTFSNFKWENSNSAVLTSTDNHLNMLSFTTYDNGTTWIGSDIGTYSGS